MPIPLSISKDINGLVTTGEESCRAFTDVAHRFILSANTVEVVTVPQNPTPTFGGRKMMAHFEFAIATGNPVVWVLPAASPTLTLPDGTVTLTISELNPGPREVIAGQTLQLLTSQADVNVSITYYVIQ